MSRGGFIGRRSSWARLSVVNGFCFSWNTRVSRYLELGGGRYYSGNLWVERWVNEEV